MPVKTPVRITMERDPTPRLSICASVSATGRGTVAMARNARHESRPHSWTPKRPPFTWRETRRPAPASNTLVPTAMMVGIIIDTEMSTEGRLEKAAELFQNAFAAQMSGELDTAVELYKKSIEVYPTAE